MNTRQRQQMAWALFLIGSALAVPVAIWNVNVRTTHLTGLSNGLAVLGFAFIGALGLLLALRRPDNVFGWMFLGILIWAELLQGITLYAQSALGQNPRPSGTDLAVWIVEWAGFPLVCVLTLFPVMLFPTGRVISPRWRWLPRAAVIVTVLWTIAWAFQGSQPVEINGIATPNPYAPSWADPLVNAAPAVLALPVLVLFGLGIATLVMRFRAGDDTVRAQIKWFTPGLIVWTVVLLYPGDHGTGGAVEVVASVGIVVLPLTIFLAILRYRLFDIDRLISRTLSYVIVTALLVGIYASLVLGVTAVVGGDAPWVVAASTLAAAALARPLYQRIQTLIDRRFDRTRYDQLRTIDTFGRSLRSQVHTDDVSHKLTATVQTALQPAFVSVTLRRLP